MKRTYVDILGDYYDSQEDFYEGQTVFLRPSDLRKAHQPKAARRKHKLREN